MYFSRKSIFYFLFIISSNLFTYIAIAQRKETKIVSKKPPNFSDLSKIAYGYASFIGDTSKLNSALQQISRKTCIEFEEKNFEVKSDEGFTFQRSTGCYAPNGPIYRDKNRILYIRFNDQCAPNVSDITSLVLRTIGLLSPINRPDRDDYVSIDINKVSPSRRSLFVKYSYDEVNLYNTSFDFSSLALFKNIKIGPRQAIIPNIKSMYNVIHNRDEPSLNDYKVLDQMYCSNKTSPYQTICYNGGYEDAESPGTCICPDFFNSSDCSTLMESDKLCSLVKNSVLNETNKEIVIFFYGYRYCYQEIFSPSAKNVTIIVNQAKMTEDTCIPGNGIEIKYLPDFGAAGLRLCGYHKNIKLYSNSTKMLVAFRGNTNFDYIIATFKIS